MMRVKLAVFRLRVFIKEHYTHCFINSTASVMPKTIEEDSDPFRRKTKVFILLSKWTNQHDFCF